MLPRLQILLNKMLFLSCITNFAVHICDFPKVIIAQLRGVQNATATRATAHGRWPTATLSSMSFCPPAHFRVQCKTVFPVFKSLPRFISPFLSDLSPLFPSCLLSFLLVTLQGQPIMFLGDLFLPSSDTSILLLLQA